MRWDDVLTIADALAIPALVVTIIGAYLHYSYSDKSKRAEFRRNALYERKLSTYESILTNARLLAARMEWILRMLDFHRTVGSVMTGVPEAERPAFERRLRAFMSIIRGAEETAGGHATASWADLSTLPGSEGFQALFDKDKPEEMVALVKVLVLAIRAESEFRHAVDRLKLLGCPAELSERVDSLAEDLLASAPEGEPKDAKPAERADAFAARVRVHVEALVLAMHSDLDSTMSS